MNILLPEIVLLLYKGFHHLNTGAVLEDQSLCFPIFLNLKKLKKIVCICRCMKM